MRIKFKTSLMEVFLFTPIFDTCVFAYMTVQTVPIYCLWFTLDLLLICCSAA